MLKIFSRSTPKLKLITEESIPGRVWVHKYKRLFGGKRTIQRYDATIENVKGPKDADFYNIMGRVQVNLDSSSTRGNIYAEGIIASATPQKPIRVTTYKIEDDVHSENNKVVGLIQSGDKKWVYRCGDGMPIFEFIDKEKILRDASLRKK